ncbi:MAG: hypothetical protein QM778_28055 [Myxococcales bacterium]
MRFIWSEDAFSTKRRQQLAAALLKVHRFRADSQVVLLVDALISRQELAWSLCEFYTQLQEAHALYDRPELVFWSVGEIYPLALCTQYGVRVDRAELKAATEYDLDDASPSPPSDVLMRALEAALAVARPLERRAAIDEVVHSVTGSMYRDEAILGQLAVRLADHFNSSGDVVAFEVAASNMPRFVGGHAHSWCWFYERIDEKKASVAPTFATVQQPGC